MNYGTVKNIGNGRVDVQLTGSAMVMRNVKISAQVDWNTLVVGTQVLVDTVEDKPVVLHTLVDVPHIYTSDEGQLVVAAPGATFPDNVLLADGSVPLTGDLPVTPGAKVDGYDISVLGQTIDNLQAADSVARTGYTVMTHASHLVESISQIDTTLLIRHNIFQDTESLSLSNTDGEIEVMKVNGEPVATVDDRGAVCYAYSVIRRIATSPANLNVGWAASTLISGLTLRGYTAFDNRHNRDGSPSMRFVLHTDIANNLTEHIVRVGSLNGILGFDTEDYGFAFGRLSSVDKFMSYSYTDNLLRIRGADISVSDPQGTEVFRIWGTAEGGHTPGDYRAGPAAGGHHEWTSVAGRMSFYSGAEETIWFSPEGSHFGGMVWAGNPTGPKVGIGLLNGEGAIVARNAFDVAQFVLRTQSDPSKGVYLFAGNPKPSGNWLEFDNGLTMDGTIRARSIQLIGTLEYSEGMSGGNGQVPEIIIRDPSDPRRYAHIKSRYLAGYSVDDEDTQYLSTLIAWAPTTLEVVPGSGQWVDFKAGESFWGDWRRGHFRIEKNRIGQFYGDTPKAWMDDQGNFNAFGGFAWANGKGKADAIGIEQVESVGNYWKVKPNANNFMEVVANGGTSFRAIYGSEDEGIGVYGQTNSGYGVYGDASGGVGVFGRALDAGGVGVYALAGMGAAQALLVDGDSGFSGVTKLGDGGIADYAQFAGDGSLSFFGAATLSARNGVTSDGSGMVNLCQFGGIITVDGYYNNLAAPRRAFDGRPGRAESQWNNNAWVTSNALPNWLQFDFGRARTVYFYKIATSNIRYPIDWKLQGSSDGANWVDVDTRSGQSFASNNYAYRRFDLAAPATYRYWRLYVTGRYWASSLYISELYLGGYPDATDLTTWQSFTLQEGKLGLGTNNPQTRLHITDPATPTYPLVMFDQYGSVSWGGNDTTLANALTFFGKDIYYSDYPALRIGYGDQSIAFIAKNQDLSNKPAILFGNGGNGFALDGFNYRSWQDYGTYGHGFYTKGSGASAVARFTISGNADTATVAAQNAYLAVGHESPDAPLHVLKTDSGTGDVANTFVLSRNSSGTTAKGFGSSVLFELRAGTTSDTSAALIEALWNNATYAAREGDLVLSVYDYNAKREGMRISSNGSSAKVGFLGAAPVARTAAYTVSNGTTDRTFDADATSLNELADVLATLILDLKGYGLLG